MTTKQERPQPSDFQRILDELIKAAETNDTISENEIFMQIADWEADDIKDFSKMTNEVLNDLDRQYSYVKSRFVEMKHKSSSGSPVVGAAAASAKDDKKPSTYPDPSFQTHLTKLQSENNLLSQEEKYLKKKLEKLKAEISRKENVLIDHQKKLVRKEALEDQYTNEYFDYKVDYIEYKKNKVSVDYWWVC